MYQDSFTQVSPAGCTLDPLKQPQATEQDKQLGRIVFDDLFDFDFLGFLLSSQHFQTHLTRLELRSTPEVARRIHEILSNELDLLTFHNLMLAMYSGVYIEECECKSRAELMDVLDGKYLRITGENDALYDVVVDEPNKVEAAWLYRGVCNNGTSILKMQQ